MDFLQPFEGRQAPIETVALFLLSPDVYLKLSGTTRRTLFKEMGVESLYKGIERCMARDLTPSPKLMKDLKDQILGQLPPPPGEIKIDGHLRPWYCFLSGLHKTWNTDTWPYSSRFVQHLELSCLEISQPLELGRFDDALKIFRAHDLLSLFLWPEAETALLRASDSSTLRPVQYSLLLEASLSMLAAWDVVHKESALYSSGSEFEAILPNDRENPTARLFGWICNETGKDLNGLSDSLGENGDIIDQSTLARWQRGKHQPNHKKFRKVTKTLFQEEMKSEQASRLFFAARWINLLGYLAASMRSAVDKSMQDRHVHITSQLKPWPDLPHGCATFSEWCVTRYPVWVDFHRSKRVTPKS